MDRNWKVSAKFKLKMLHMWSFLLTFTCTVQNCSLLNRFPVVLFFHFHWYIKKKKSQLYNLRKISPQNRYLLSFIHTIYVKFCNSKFWYLGLKSNARCCCEWSQLQIWRCPIGSIGAVILHVVDDIVPRFCMSFSYLIVYILIFVGFLIFIFSNYEIISTCIWFNFVKILMEAW